MGMTVVIAPELEPFVEAELAGGAIGTREELVAKALVLYREMKNRHEQLREEVARARAEAAAGDVAPLDIEDIIGRGYERLAKDGITD
jgi:Arc/MetJ-type ribon-helix-helix transcriptional regulator